MHNRVFKAGAYLLYALYHSEVYAYHNLCALRVCFSRCSHSLERTTLNITTYGRGHEHSFWRGGSYIPVLLATWRFFLE